MSFENPLPGVPSIESPFFRQLFDADHTDAQTLKAARDLQRDGFAVIDFPEPDFDRLATEIRATLDDRFDWEFWRKDGHRRGISLRVQDAWQEHAAVRKVACNPAVLDLLSRLYGRRAWPFQTLNFPVGTQQHFHTDSVHFSSVPERFMCGVWVALEDIDESNGPLVYYPGSHRWPIYANEHIGVNVSKMAGRPTQQLYEPMWRALIEAGGIQPQYFHAKRGQALIWAANLLHGGAHQKDPLRTRWSQVTHYFFEDCAYYTPMLSDPAFGRTDFRQLTNIVTGQVMPQRYAGHDIPQSYVEASRGGNMAWQEMLADFDADAYLAANPDVAAAGVNPAEHYLMHGIKEKRRLRL
jgi:hypothetical protein